MVERVRRRVAEDLLIGIGEFFVKRLLSGFLERFGTPR